MFLFVNIFGLRLQRHRLHALNLESGNVLVKFTKHVLSDSILHCASAKSLLKKGKAQILENYTLLVFRTSNPFIYYIITLFGSSLQFLTPYNMCTDNVN